MDESFEAGLMAAEDRRRRGGRECVGCGKPVTASEIKAAHESVCLALSSTKPGDWPDVCDDCAGMLEDLDR